MVSCPLAAGLNQPVRTEITGFQSGMLYASPRSSASHPHLRSFMYSHVQRSCYMSSISSPQQHRLVGLVVKASASRVEDPGFESR